MKWKKLNKKLVLWENQQNWLKEKSLLDKCKKSLKG